MSNYSLLIGASIGPYTTGIGLFPKGRRGYRKSEVFFIDLLIIHVFLYSKN
jgi:hypothetical protein